MLSRSFSIVALLFLPAVALAACGSSNAADLFPAGAGATAPASTSTTADSGTSSPATKDGGSGMGTDPSDAGTAKKDASPTDAGAITKDSGGTTVVDSGNGAVDAAVNDTGPGYIDPGIYCGTDSNNVRTLCDPASQACCLRGGNPSYECKPATGPNSMCPGLRVPCDDSADCGGWACCATYDKGVNQYVSVVCQSTCDTSTAVGNTTLHRLCDPNAPIDECASFGMSCQASTAIDGWYVCK